MDAKIEAVKSRSFSHKQSRFKQLDGMLPCRMIAAGPSGAGKGYVFVNMILKHFRGCWERIYIFSPTALLDKTWDPIRKYIREDLGVNTEKEPAFFEEWDHGATLDKLVKQHSEVVRKQKERKDSKTIYGALFIIDDWGDNFEVMHKASGSVINRLFLSGRHHGCSCILGVQKLTLVSTVCRVNATGLLCFKVRNQKEYESIESEVTALVDRDTFREVWEAATSEPYSFLFIRLNAKSLNETFMLRFEKHFTFE
jgi:hypothetical protein